MNKPKARTGRYKLFDGIPIEPFASIRYSTPSVTVIKAGDVVIRSSHGTLYILRASGVLLREARTTVPSYPQYERGYGDVRKRAEDCLELGLVTEDDIVTLMAWCKDDVRRAEIVNTQNTIRRLKISKEEALRLVCEVYEEKAQ